MEYLCRFPIDSGGFFTVKLIDECTPKKNEGSPIETEGIKYKEYVLVLMLRE